MTDVLLVILNALMSAGEQSLGVSVVRTGKFDDVLFDCTYGGANTQLDRLARTAQSLA